MKAKVKLKKYQTGGTTLQEEQYLNYQDQQQQADSSYNTGMQTVSKVPVFGQAIAGIAGIGDAIGKPIKNSVERMDANGNLENRNASTIGHTAGVLFNPYKTLSRTMTDKSASTGQKWAAGLTGGVSDVFFAKKYNDDLEKNAKAEIAYNQTIEDQQNQMYARKGGMMKCADGGMLPNAELESQENTLNPDGSTNQYNGPSHEAGGIPTKLDPGTLIFSDKLKLPGTKKTFASLNKENMTSKEDKILSDKKADSTARITAELMKQAKNKKSIALFQEQENLKQSKLDNYTKRLGGVQKYFGGGFVPPTEDDTYGMEAPQYTSSNGTNYYASQNNSGINSNELAIEASRQGIYDFENSNRGGSNMTTYDNSPSPTNSNTGNRDYSSYINAGAQIGSFAASNIGNFYDLKRAKKVDKESYNRVTPAYLDPSAALSYNNTAFRKGAADVRNAAVGNSATYIQNRKDLAINQMLANARIRSDYDNRNNEIGNQAKYYNAGIGDKETIANMMNQAQARNIKSSAYSNLGYNAGQAITGSVKDYNMQQRDKEYLRILAAKYPEIMKDPELSKYYK